MFAGHFKKWLDYQAHLCAGNATTAVANDNCPGLTRPMISATEGELK